MKLNKSVIFVAALVALAIVALVYRIATAPERIRMRLDTAKASCINAGSEWVKVGHEELCRAAADRK